MAVHALERAEEEVGAMYLKKMRGGSRWADWSFTVCRGSTCKDYRHVSVMEKRVSW